MSLSSPVYLVFVRNYVQVKVLMQATPVSAPATEVDSESTQSVVPAEQTTQSDVPAVEHDRHVGPTTSAAHAPHTGSKRTDSGRVGVIRNKRRKPRYYAVTSSGGITKSAIRGLARRGGPPGGSRTEERAHDDGAGAGA
jgi:hypothetical protein